jgi:hypothetical protein
MPRPEIVDDILWGQLHKLIGQLTVYLADFQPKSILADDSQHLVRLAIILTKAELPKKMLVAGPPLSMKSHVEKFKKSHKKARFIKKDQKIYAEVVRPLTNAEIAIMGFFRSYAAKKSHLAYPEEMLVLERIEHGNKPPRANTMKSGSTKKIPRPAKRTKIAKKTQPVKIAKKPIVKTFTVKIVKKAKLAKKTHQVKPAKKASHAKIPKNDVLREILRIESQPEDDGEIPLGNLVVKKARKKVTR